MNLFKQTLIIFLSILILTGCGSDQRSEKSEITLGIIEPMEHTAMAEIVAGFSETMKTSYPHPINIKVMNAQGDANLQRSIIQTMRDQAYTIILPIGVSTTQMTLAMTKQQKVVSLASDLSDQERKSMHPCHAAAVHDEISSDQVLAFIHTAYPALTRLTLIHSATDKVMPDVKKTVLAGKKYGINVDTKMVATLPELYSISQSITADTQGIFVLKDSLIVSGIGTLAKTAAEHKIPLITSDQGSVQDGASIALGVHERDIGVEGAKLTAAILNGKAICDLPIVGMTQLTVFINPTAMSATQQPLKPVMHAAAKLHYQTDIINKQG